MKRLISFIFIFLLTGIVFAQRVDTSLVVGEFTIEKVTDGDTFRFKGLDKSTRLLGIDTEETYKDKKAREKSSELEKNWPQAYYDQQKASKHKRPVKMDTPFGFEAWMWAKDISSNVSKVRLEKDENARYIDSYGRYLVYVILYKDGKWVISEVSDKKTPYLIRIGIRIGLNFDIVLFEENAELLPLLKMDEKKDYYIYAKGKLTEYRGKYQIVLNNVEQLWME